MALAEIYSAVWQLQSSFKAHIRPCTVQVLRLVTELRQAGHFTAVAVTRPFDFEGKRRAEAAETLITALEEAAHFVTVIEQVRGSSLPRSSVFKG